MQQYKNVSESSTFKNASRSNFSDLSIKIGHVVAGDLYTPLKNFLGEDRVVLTPAAHRKEKKSTVIQAHPVMYVMYYNTTKDNNTNNYIVPSKIFNCFINRIDPIRQSWFYLLIRNQLFDHGRISFNMDSSRAEDPIWHSRPVDYFEHCHNNYLSEFDQEYEFCKRNLNLPYRNFDADADLDDIIMDTKFSIVLETYFDPERIQFTEKIFRVLLLPRPWLLFGSPGAVAQLKSWGFDVLDDLVDHNEYDSIEFEIDRQRKIIELAQRMQNFDITQHQSRLAAAQNHNINLVKDWKDRAVELLYSSFCEYVEQIEIQLKKHNLL